LFAEIPKRVSIVAFDQFHRSELFILSRLAPVIIDTRDPSELFIIFTPETDPTAGVVYSMKYHLINELSRLLLVTLNFK
jgi:hypothetical protein